MDHLKVKSKEGIPLRAGAEGSQAIALARGDSQAEMIPRGSADCCYQNMSVEKGFNPLRTLHGSSPCSLGSVFAWNGRNPLGRCTVHAPPPRAKERRLAEGFRPIFLVRTAHSVEKLVYFVLGRLLSHGLTKSKR